MSTQVGRPMLPGMVYLGRWLAPEEDVDVLNAVCDATGISRSQLLRNAVRLYAEDLKEMYPDIKDGASAKS